MMENILYFVFFAGMFALMMRFGCGAHVMGHHGNHVDSMQAKSAVYRGHAYYFCSPACREKFEAAPSSFINPKITGATA